MKKPHLFLYGLLSGAVLVLSCFLILEVGDTNRATGQDTTMKGEEVVVATGQVQGNEHVLWILAPNTDPDHENMTLMTYTVRNYQPELVGARSIKYDRRLIDAVFRRGEPQGKTQPTVEKIGEAYRRNKKNKEKESED